LQVGQQGGVQRFEQAGGVVALHFGGIGGHHIKAWPFYRMHMRPQCLVGIDKGHFDADLIALLKVMHHIRVGIAGQASTRSTSLAIANWQHNRQPITPASRLFILDATFGFLFQSAV
jgi:hypothetical protein